MGQARGQTVEVRQITTTNGLGRIHRDGSCAARELEEEGGRIGRTGRTVRTVRANSQSSQTSRGFEQLSHLERSVNRQNEKKSKRKRRPASSGLLSRRSGQRMVITANTAILQSFKAVKQQSQLQFALVSLASPRCQFHSSTRIEAKRNKMPPKKGAPAVDKPKLGRPSNNLKMGIVGVPNVGKSSLFNVVSKCDLGKSANFPYATIEPEEARVPVPDERFLWLVEKYKPKSEVPAFLTCIDIAGLTAGASTGAGLGNAFLSNVRAVDGIFQVVRAFDDADIVHVEGDVNPCRDMEIISTELRLKDIEWVEKSLDTAKKASRGSGPNTLEGKRKLEEIATMEKALKALQEENRDIRKVDWSAKEVSFDCRGSDGTGTSTGDTSDSKDEQEGAMRPSKSNNPARR